MITLRLPFTLPYSRMRSITIPLEPLVFVLSGILAVVATTYYFSHNEIIAYLDAESHLNIAKRVVSSLTPGFAQLGGIWLPLPHLLMVPFVMDDFLWRTGLAGSIVSGTAFVIASLYIYKLGVLLTKNSLAGLVAAGVFMTNANVLYLQSTPLTELTLIATCTVSTYYFIKFILNREDLLNLILAGIFGVLASLSRYDGWGLVLVELGVLVLLYFPYSIQWKYYVPFIVRTYPSLTTKKALSQMEGKAVLFGTLALLGVAVWLVWGWAILGDALYFTHSQFSANSQQSSWLSIGQLPAYHHLWVAIQYYFMTTYATVGSIVCALAIIGTLAFFLAKEVPNRALIFFVLFVPFAFNVATLFIGQSVIFIPSLTPTTFEWTLFNVRYGSMMVPFVAVMIGFLFSHLRMSLKALIIVALTFQIALPIVLSIPPITVQDGTVGLSAYRAREPGLQEWLNTHYDGGTVLVDDYARSISILRSTIPMKSVLYVGTKPYWDEALAAPQTEAQWVIIQKGDTIWNALMTDPAKEALLTEYYTKVFISPDITIYKRIASK